MSTSAGQRRSSRIAAAITLVLALTVALAPAPDAGAQQTTLTLTPDVVVAGETTQADGENFTAHATVRLHLDEIAPATQLAETGADAAGAFSVTVTIPADTPPGGHMVMACEVQSFGGCQLVARTPITVEPRPAPTPTPTDEPTEPTTPTPTRTPTATPTTSTAEPSPAATIDAEPSPEPESTSAPADPDGFVARTLPPRPEGPTTITIGELPPGVPDFHAGQVPDLFVTGMEITQSMQNLANEMPLVAGRTTVVRASVATDGATVGGVTGAMQVSPPGGSPVVVYPVNGPIVADPGGSDRLDPDTTLNFLLPPDATVQTGSGTTELHVYVYSQHPTSPNAEPDAANNHGFADVEFHEAPPLAIRMFPIHLHHPWPDGPEATFGTFGPNFLADAVAWLEILNAAYRYFPTPQILALPGVTLYPEWHDLDPFGYGVPDEVREWRLNLDGHHSQVNSVLLSHWEQSTPVDEFEQFYGAFPPGVPSALGGQSNTTVAHGLAQWRHWQSSPWFQFGGMVAAHEIAHNMGFKHSPCKGTEASGGAVEPYPFSGPPCTIAEPDPDGWFGFDVAWQSFAHLDSPPVISNDPWIGPTHRGYPVMGYHTPSWADPYYWCRMLTRFGVECRALQIPENLPSPDPDLPEFVAEQYDPLAAEDGWLRLSAEIDVEAGRARLLDVRRVDDPGSRVLDEYARRRAAGHEAGRETDISLALLSETGSVILDLPVITDTVHAEHDVEHGDEAHDDHDHVEHHGPTSVEVVSDYLPWSNDVRVIAVRRDHETLDERSVSVSPPNITVTGPQGGTYEAPLEVTWEASDPDGDPLAFTVSYSPDGGETWTLLARNVTGDDYTVESFDVVAGGDRAVFRVDAYDGVHVTSALSEEGVVPDGPPSLIVTSPADGAWFALHEPVEVRASAFDWEDGIDALPEVSWRSDVDGDLGAGSAALASDLSAGEHTITATAADSAGNEAEASVAIVVDDRRVLPRATEDDLDDLLAILARGPVEAETSGGRAGWLVLALLTAGLAVGGVFVGRSRRRRLVTGD